jgi:hypothetical protein
MANSIGTFAFNTLATAGRSGSPELLREETEPVNRPGTDGTGVRLLGRKGKPFQMTSSVDVLSHFDGIFLTTLYKNLVGAPPQELVWAGINYVAYGVVYVVLEVGDFQVIRVRNHIGGFHGILAGAHVRATWLLQPVPDTT